MLAGFGLQRPNADFGRQVRGEVFRQERYQPPPYLTSPHTHTNRRFTVPTSKRDGGKKRPNRPMTGIVFSAAQTTWKSNELMFSSH